MIHKQKLFQWFILDSFIIMMAYIAVFILVSLLGIERDIIPLLQLFTWVVPLKIIIYYFSGLYKLIAKSIGFEDLIRISSLVFLSNFSLGLIFWLFGVIDVVGPIQLFIITFVEWISIGASRSFFRLYPLFLSKIFYKGIIKRTLILGAGLEGEMVVKEFNKDPRASNYPILFVDDDINKQGRRLLGLPIQGPSENIENLINQYKIDEVIVAMSDIPIKKLSDLLDRIAKTHASVKRVSTFQEIRSGEVFQIRPVQIVDLLNREEVHLNNEAILNLVQEEIVLITGGGGSIGSELTRQIAEMNPKQIIIYDIYENTTYSLQTNLEHSFKKKNKALDLKVIIGSVYNEKRLENIFDQYKPTLVFHAAAYKHVPLMEESSVEALRTNVLGTYYLAKLAVKYKIKKMILISSDKAVRPSNIMGATKRLAEIIIKTIQKDSKSTSFAAVRFGNVLGSHGSVIPLFRHQIESGGPVTVTDKEVTRYFMTIPESVSLILEAATYAKDGEIFVLDMGEPIKIIDLAEKMIKLAGLKPYQDIDIEFIGLREGEKKFEELILDDAMKKTYNKKIYIDPSKSDNNLDWLMKFNSVDSLNNEEIKVILKNLKLDYSPENQSK